MPRTAFFIILLAACAKTLTLEQALSRIVPSPPAQPESPADSLLLVAVSHAVVEGIPDFAPRRRVIIEKRDAVSPRMLPVVDSVTFFILDLAGIQKLANRVGSFTFLRVHSPEIFGDARKWRSAACGPTNRPEDLWGDWGAGHASGCSRRRAGLGLANAFWAVSFLSVCLTSA